MNECINSNTIGSNEVFNFCLSNKINLYIQQHQQVLEIKEMIKIYLHMHLLKQKI